MGLKLTRIRPGDGAPVNHVTLHGVRSCHWIRIRHMKVLNGLNSLNDLNKEGLPLRVKPSFVDARDNRLANILQADRGEYKRRGLY